MNLNTPLKIGFSFGITSGIITTLGLMIGLSASSSSKIIVIGGILTIAVADSLSDALGIHISQETDRKKPWQQIWESAGATFLGKFFLAIIFVIPVVLFDLNQAILVSIIFSFIILSLLSYYIARLRRQNPFEIILEHIVITALVIALTQYIGTLIRTYLAV